MSEIDPGSGRDPVEELLESFLGRLREGERPNPEEFAARCPDRAEEIIELLPALVEIERLKPSVGDEPGAHGCPADRSGATGRQIPPLPERLGDYQILRVVGEGGMGVVYEAEHESLRSRVALKVMHPGFRADASHIRRFRQEARSAARLHHTNIVPVFDYGEQDGICYYAMQYIAGVALNQVLEDVRRLREDPDAAAGAGTARGRDDRRTRPLSIAGTAPDVAEGLLTGRFKPGPNASCASETPTVLLEPGQASRTAPPAESGPAPSPPRVEGAQDDPGSSSFARQPESIYFREVARLGAQVADALDYAHRQGVVHRDVKPSNLLLDAQGNVWITDFGLAKLLEGDELSQSHDLVGTLRFMAPERFRGATDRRSDVYSLGATLYEMLALRPAFDERDQIRLIDRVTHQPPSSLRQHDRRIPRDLETLVLRAMAKDPKDRFATAGELRDELRRFLEGRPIRSRPVPIYEQAWRWCRRNRLLAAAMGTAAVLVAFVTISAPIAALIYRTQLSRVLEAERAGRLELGRSHQAEGAALQRTGAIGQRFLSLERLGQAAPLLRMHPEGRDRLSELRDQAITAMGLTDLRRVGSRQIGPKMGIAWDPALGRYATIEMFSQEKDAGVVVVRTTADDHEILRVPRPAPVFWWGSVAFSPDGRYLMIAYHDQAGGQYDLWDLGRKERVFSQHLYGLLFHPDGRRLILRPAEKEIALWDMEPGRESRRFSLDFTPADLCLDAEGRRIAANAASDPRKVVILELESGRAIATWREKVGKGRMSWSRDGRLLAICNDDGRVLVRDVERGTLASVLHDDLWGAGDCRFSPVGHLLLTTSFGGSAELWDGSSGGLLVTAPIIRAASFSADGRYLATHDGSNIETWEIAHRGEVIALNPGLIGNRTEKVGRGHVLAAQFSPDGRLLALATPEATRLYDSRDGRELGRLETGPADSLLFDRGGRNLISFSQRGLYRWPIREDDGDPGSLRIGPPAFLHEAPSPSRWKAAWLPDGRTLALNDHDHSRVWLVDTEHPHAARHRVRALATPGRSRMISVAVSPDGRWAAAGSWNDPGVYVWDLPRRRYQRVLPRGDTVADGHTLPSFSPDGRWLVYNSNVEAASGYYFWEVGTWRRGRYIPRPAPAGWAEPVFSPDGTLIAMSHDTHRVRLAETATGRTIAHLTTPHPLAPAPLAFSPDGTRLVASTNRRIALIWDLRRIRERLRAMDLDWDRPPYPPEGHSPGAASSGVHSLSVLGAAPETAARRAADLAAADGRLRDHPDDAEALLDRGWLKLTMARTAEALADLDRGSRLRPGDPDALYLLARAQAATNDRTAARATLERYLALAGDDTDAHVLKGQLALQLGLLGEAVGDLGAALELDPARDSLRYTRMQIRLKLGQLQEALRDLDVLVPGYPRDANLLGLRGLVLDRLGRIEPAMADLDRAAELSESPGAVFNDLAWKLATGPAALRHPPKALEFARKAVAASPETAMYLNTLGVALYRAGRPADAVVALEKSLAAGTGENDPFDLFFLAMARHHLGRADRARADFDRAVEWRRVHPNPGYPGWAEELDAFQAEARDVLAEPLPPPPDDAFATGPEVHP